jgi:chromosome segregation ATPase
MGLEARIAELESEIQDLEATFELDNNLKHRQETLVHHLQLQVSDLNLALESKDSEAQKATYDLRISMQGQISGLQSSLDQISIELSQKNRELEDLHDQYSLEL